MIISQLMTTDVLVASPDMSLKEVASLLAASGVSGLPVVEHGEVIGVISEADILVKERVASDHPAHPDTGRNVLKAAATTVAEAMTSPAITVMPRRNVDEVARLMTDKRINRLPVVDGGTLVGIVTRADLVRAFARPDAEIEREIRDEVFAETFWIDPDVLHVSVVEGAVTLGGSVESRTLAEVLPRFVLAVPGVVSVEADLDWSLDDRREPLAPAS